jgi:hypothetical protein
MQVKVMGKIVEIRISAVQDKNSVISTQFDDLALIRDDFCIAAPCKADHSV